MRKKDVRRSSVTLRAVLIGLLFVPMNIYLVVQWETVWGTQYPTTMSIFFNAIFDLFLISIANLGLRRAFPRHALSQGELLTIYIVLNTAIAVSGHDFTQTIFCTLGTAHWYATPENEWSTLFWRYVPRLSTVQDMAVLRPFYEGDSTLYNRAHILGWLRPMAWWTIFLTAIAFTALCLNSLVRRQWIEHEKLSYPLTELPFEMTNEKTHGFLQQPLLWTGFGIAAGIDVVNGLSYLFPAIPSIPLLFDLREQINEKPWIAMGDFRVQLNPYVIGLAFTIPLDLIFSSWFFFFVWKAQRVLGSVAGVNTPGYPFPDQQILGGYLAIGAVLVWTGRRFFWDVATKGLRFVRRPDEDQEPMSYRFAVWGGLGGLALLVGMLYQGGMRVWFAAGFFAVYFGILFAFTRMRAEVGPPLQGVHYSGPLQLMVALVGSRNIPIQSLTVAAPLWTHTKEIRNHPMPYQLESYKLAQRAHMDTRRLWKVIIIVTFLAVPITFWAFLQASYKWGGVGGWRGVAAYNTIERWALRREGPDTTFLWATAVGAIVVLANTALRLRFVGWQLHPLGYLLAGYYHFERLWFPFIIAWAAKRLILQFGGIRGYRKALPFFLGLVLGEFVIGSAWGLIGLLTGLRTYAFKGW